MSLGVGDTDEFFFRLMTAYHKYFHTPSIPAPKLAGQTIRIGLIGASKIAPVAVIFPALYHPEVEIVSVGARSKAKAVAYAKQWGIKEEKAFGSYE